MLYRLSINRWYLERLVYLIGGGFTLGGTVLGFVVSPYFFYFVALVGLMQIVFALTGYCPMAIFLNLIGVKGR